jgi:hypothetical protein
LNAVDAITPPVLGASVAIVVDDDDDDDEAVL